MDKTIVICIVGILFCAGLLYWQASYLSSLLNDLEGKQAEIKTAEDNKIKCEKACSPFSINSVYANGKCYCAVKDEYLPLTDLQPVVRAY